jgi:hypothetical protein
MIEGIRFAEVPVLKMEKTERKEHRKIGKRCPPDTYRNPLSPSHHF